MLMVNIMTSEYKYLNPITNNLEEKNITSRLKNLVIFETSNRTNEPDGKNKIIWQEYLKLYAEIKPVTANEFLFAGRLYEVVTHRIIIRYRNDITSQMRIRFQHRIFNIVTITNPFEQNILLEIDAKENIICKQS